MRSQRPPSGIAPGLVLLLALNLLAPLAEAGRTEVRSNDVLFTDISSATDVTADPDHRSVWFATDGGLVRTDPDLTNRTILTPYHGLPASHVVASRVVGDDLWVATTGGLARVDIQTLKITPFTQLQGALHDFLFALEANATDLWVGSNEGLLHYDLAGRTSEAFNTTNSPLPANRVFSVSVHGDHVWAGTLGGLARLHVPTKTWTTWTRDVEQNALTAMRNVVAAPAGAWAAGENGVVHVDAATGNVTPFSLAPAGVNGKRVRDITPNGLETWFATDQGIAIHEGSDGSWRRTGARQGLSSDLVAGISFYNATHVAIATRGGLNMLDIARVEYTVLRTVTGPYSNIIIASAMDDAGIWWGTGGGAARYSAATGTWVHLTKSDGLRGNWVYGVYVDPDRYWFATTGGISYLWRSNGTWGFQSMNAHALGGETARAIHGDDREVWVANAFLGVVRYIRATETWKGYGTGTDYAGDVKVNAVLVDDPYVWVGTETGVSRFDRRTETWSLAPTPHLQGRVITGFAQDASRVYIATASHGLMAWDRATGAFETWNATNERLASDRIRSVAVDGADLWVGYIADGAERIVLANGSRTHYTSHNGLTNDYVNTFAFTEDTVYFGTYAGIARLDRATQRFLPTQEGGRALTAAGEHAPVGTNRSNGSGEDWTTGNWTPNNWTSDSGAFFGVGAAIVYPAENESITLPYLLEGTANAPGAGVTAVYYRIDGGPWARARATTNWTAMLRPGDLEEGPHLLEVQAFSGSRPSQVVAQPFVVVPDGGSILVTHTPPKVTDPFGPIPLTATTSRTGVTASLVYAAAPNGPGIRVPLTATVSTLRGAIPAQATAGPVYYYIEARLGDEVGRSPATGHHVLQVPATPRATLERPADTLTLAPGVATTARFQLTNTGNTPLNVSFELKGIPDGMLVQGLTPRTVPVGERVDVLLTLTAPAGLLPSGRAILKVLGAGEQGLATQDFGLRVENPPAPPVQGKGGFLGIPAGSAMLSLLAATAAATFLPSRRRR